MLKTKIAAIAGAAALLVTLGSCSGTSQEQAATDGAQASTTAAVSHDAVISPDDIHPGWVVEDDYPAGTSDLWYPDGNESKMPTIYFTNAANDAGMTVTFVDADDHEDSVWDVEVVDDHLKIKDSAKGEEREVDFTFQDAFTCYDAVSNTTFVRGATTAADVAERFAGKVFVADKDDPEERMVSFADDGTLTLTTGSKVASGTWEAVAVNVAEVHLASDTSEWDDEWRVIVDKGGNPTELDEGAATSCYTKSRRFGA